MDDTRDQSNSSGGNDAIEGGGPESSSSQKIFDITSDLNIMPVSEAEIAEEKKDVPIPNFAEKIAAQTKNARIYREGQTPPINKLETPEANAPIPKANTLNTDASPAGRPTVSEQTVSGPTVGGPITSALGETIVVPPEIAKKYHTSTVVETKPWVKNKINTSVENAKEGANISSGTENVINQENVTGLDNTPSFSDRLVRGGSKGPILSGGRRLFAGKGLPKLGDGTVGPIHTINRTGIDEGTDMEVNSQEHSKKLEGSLKPLRTYESDVAEILSKTKASTTTIAIAESKRAAGEESLKSDIVESSHAGRKLLMALLSLILVGAGAGGAYYLYLKSPLAPAPTTTTQEPTISSLVNREGYSLVAIDNLSPLQIQYKIQSEVSAPQDIDTIRELILTKTVNGARNRVSGPEFIDAMDVEMPDVLKRSLSDAWMLGVYTDEYGTKDVFIVLTNSFFQNAFAGMLQWENVMADDIKQYLLPVAPFGIANIPDISGNIPNPIQNSLQELEKILPATQNQSTSSTTATTTATTTTGAVAKNAVATTTPTTTATTTATTTETYPAIQPLFTIRGNFEDRIIRNKDVRAFRTTEGKILFLYSFIDNQRLIITTKESTLNEILSRLEKEAFVR